jgi:Raf kinase inhibitor-like YbhB/YbcL family protein
VNRLVASLVPLGALVLTGCASMHGDSAGPANAFRLTSPDFADNALLPARFAGNNKTNPNCAGENATPALTWSNAPAKTRSFAILMDDQAGRNGLGVSHWVAYGIPVSVTSLAEGEAGRAPTRYLGGRNTVGWNYALGPCPPRGNAAQHYVYTLIATDLEPNALPPGLTKAELIAALNGRALRAASFVTRFAH